MRETESNLVLSNQQKVYTVTWQPQDGCAKANLILVHGIGQYSHFHKESARFFTENGYAVHAFDHIGHGHSDGKLGTASYATSFEIINQIKAQLSKEEKPLFLLGHSMGGGVVLNYGILYSEYLNGIIATSPAVGLANPKPALEMTLLRLIKKVLPWMTIDNGLDKTNLSRDPETIRINDADSLSHRRVSLTLGMDLIDYGLKLQKYTQKYPCPLLVLQGDADRIVDPIATENFARQISGNVTFKKFDGGYHELHNDLEKELMHQTILDWMNSV